jgi:hypothetical protein
MLLVLIIGEVGCGSHIILSFLSVYQVLECFELYPDSHIFYHLIPLFPKEAIGGECFIVSG